MAKVLKCADIGRDCDFVARADTQEELLKQVVAHAAEAHGVTEITPDLHAKVAALIRDVT